MHKKLLFISTLTAALSCFFFTAQAGSWQSDGRGWWYRNDNGSSLKSSWIKDKDLWYYLDSEGYMKTGWLLDGSTWYYLEKDGSMCTTVLKPDDVNHGVTYYFDSSGACTNPYDSYKDTTRKTKKLYSGNPGLGIYHEVTLTSVGKEITNIYIRKSTSFSALHVNAKSKAEQLYEPYISTYKSIKGVSVDISYDNSTVIENTEIDFNILDLSKIDKVQIAKLIYGENYSTSDLANITDAETVEQIIRKAGYKIKE